MSALLLASASPARRALLTGVGIDALWAVSRVDEDAVLADAVARYGELEVADAVLVLARAKAEAVVAALAEDGEEDLGGDDGDGPAGLLVRRAADGAPAAQVPADLFVLGCDSLLELDGAALGKPRDAADAAERWRTMRGRAGVLHTGHWLVDERPTGAGGSGGLVGATSSTTVHFADVTDAEIEAYVATGEPLAVAGAFTLDGLGGAFVRSVDGDPHGVVGLSLPLLRELVGELGATWTDLWPTPPALVGSTQPPSS